jgi:hypothetical protein
MENKDDNRVFLLARDAVQDCLFPIRWDKENLCRLRRCIEKARYLLDDPRDTNLFGDAVVALFEEEYNNLNSHEVEDTGQGEG